MSVLIQLTNCLNCSQTKPTPKQLILPTCRPPFLPCVSHPKPIIGYTFNYYCIVLHLTLTLLLVCCSRWLLLCNQLTTSTAHPSPPFLPSSAISHCSLRTAECTLESKLCNLQLMAPPHFRHSFARAWTNTLLSCLWNCIIWRGAKSGIA